MEVGVRPKKGRPPISKYATVGYIQLCTPAEDPMLIC
jgi:hypothetical protein